MEGNIMIDEKLIKLKFSKFIDSFKYVKVIDDDCVIRNWYNLFPAKEFGSIIFKLQDDNLELKTIISFNTPDVSELTKFMSDNYFNRIYSIKNKDCGNRLVFDFSSLNNFKFNY